MASAFERRADERAGEGRDAPDGREYGEELRPDIAREKPLHRNEGERHERAAAETADEAAAEQHGHGRRRRGDGAAQREDGGGGRHAAPDAEAQRELSGRCACEDGADLVDGEAPAHHLHPADIAHQRVHDRAGHGLDPGMHEDAEADEAEAREIAGAPKRRPVRLLAREVGHRGAMRWQREFGVIDFIVRFSWP